MHRRGRDFARHRCPWPHTPPDDESVADVWIGVRKLLRNRCGFALEQKDGAVDGIGQRAGENQLPFRCRLPRQRQVRVAECRSPFKVVGADVIEEEIVHRRYSLCSCLFAGIRPLSAIRVAGASGARALQSGFIGLYFGRQQLSAGEALGRPVHIAIIVFRDRRHTRRKHDPRLFRCSENMDVRRETIRSIERTDTNKLEERSGARVVTPDRDAAARAASYRLACTARRRGLDQLRLGGRVGNAIGLDYRIQRKGRAGLALAPAAMATMHEKRSGLHPIADATAIAAAFDGEGYVGSHDGDVLSVNYRLRPSTGTRLTVVSSTPSRQRTLIAAVAAPEGPTPVANGAHPQMGQKW